MRPGAGCRWVPVGGCVLLDGGVLWLVGTAPVAALPCFAASVC